jgi:hypothetical protein
MAYVLAVTFLVCLLATLESRGPAVVEGRGQAQRMPRLGIPTATDDLDKQNAILMSGWLQRTPNGEGPKREEQSFVLSERFTQRVTKINDQRSTSKRLLLHLRSGVAYVVRW